MGLDVSHGCWRGAYSAFHRWRCGLAKAAGIPVGLMEGWYKAPSVEALDWAKPRSGGPACGDWRGPMLVDTIEDWQAWLPVKWEVLKPDPLIVLLNHSDSDGWIPAAHCAPLADRLAELLPLLPTTPDRGHIGVWQEKTQRFIDGLRDAAAKGEDVLFA